VDVEDPDEHQPVVVPTRVGHDGVSCLVVCRRPDGARTGLAFTSLAMLHRVMGQERTHVTLSLDALHATLAEIGVQAVQVDPESFVHPAPSLRVAS
jgi:hypothetical protein